MTNDEIIVLCAQCFSSGVDYGLLLAEDERTQEGFADAFVCSISGRKYGVPSSPLKTRELRSDEWRKAKNESYKKFFTLIKSINENNGL